MAKPAWSKGNYKGGSYRLSQDSKLLSKADDECYARAARIDLSTRHIVIDYVCSDEVGAIAWMPKVIRYFMS